MNFPIQLRNGGAAGVANQPRKSQINLTLSFVSLNMKLPFIHALEGIARTGKTIIDPWQLPHHQRPFSVQPQSVRNEWQGQLVGPRP